MKHPASKPECCFIFMSQISSQILLVKPSRFGYNDQTAASNHFQNEITSGAVTILSQSQKEFDAFAEKLRHHGIDVLVYEDSNEPIKPDAIFPNNWISMHEDGKIILYPMCAPNRRTERDAMLIDRLKNLFVVTEVIDLSFYENEERFLEGTGSIIFNHDHKVAYACISPRTDERIFEEVCGLLNYHPVIFHSADENAVPVYHTNVMMCIGEIFAVICLESIPGKEEQNMVKASLQNSGHEIVDISFDQMKSFAGNMLAIQNKKGLKFLAMSLSAFNSLTTGQKKILEKYCTLLPLDVTTIETVGGGSARCMMAEIFLQKR